ncbi:HEPN domain-containing protein [Candidatus Magnetominusculus dajiuhuensis]|uniref:HEPN domain-containing protein n=1 Tax=Candidatus Magnetominusculus dajiuhuensis TaxID=3137712 RepID=UPI003B4356C9
MSERFEELKNRLNQLSEHFISGSKTIEQDDIRAYILLAHAEIEAYFEDITRDIAVNAYTNWNEKSTLSATLISLAIYSERNFGKVPIEIINISGTAKMNAILQTALNSFVINVSHKDGINGVVQAFAKTVEQNHGITEDRLLKLLIPIGVQKNELNNTWLVDINQFGERRGDIAHQSLTKAKEILYPLSQEIKVKRILDGIEELDKILIGLSEKQTRV